MNSQNTLQTIKLVEYRNGMYQGGFSRGRRQGKGILITDDSQIYFANWKNDTINDKALIWINQKTHVIGQFNRGNMDGQFIYRNQSGSFYASFASNNLIGQIVYIDKKQNKAKLLQYKNQNYRLINQINTYGLSQNDILEQMLKFKVFFPSVLQFVKKVMLQDNTYILKNTNLGSYYIGYNKGYTVQKLGLIMSKEELLSFGTYIDTKLQGVGCKFDGKYKYQGIFKNGFLNGYGLKCDIFQSKYIAGYFSNGNIKESDEESTSLPKISTIKKNIHLNSIYFYNTFIRTNALLRYRGYQQILVRSKVQKHTIYDSTIKSSSPIKNSSPLKKTKSITSESRIQGVNLNRNEQRVEYDRNQYKKVGLINETNSSNFDKISILRRQIQDKKNSMNENSPKKKFIQQDSIQNVRQLQNTSKSPKLNDQGNKYQDIDYLIRSKKTDRWGV